MKTVFVLMRKADVGFVFVLDVSKKTNGRQSVLESPNAGNARSFRTPTEAHKWVEEQRTATRAVLQTYEIAPYIPEVPYTGGLVKVASEIKEIDRHYTR